MSEVPQFQLATARQALEECIRMLDDAPVPLPHAVRMSVHALIAAALVLTEPDDYEDD